MHARSFVASFVATALALTVLGMAAGPVGAQTGNIAEFCAARIEANAAETKAENRAVIARVLAAAPAAAVPAITAIRDGFAKQGEKFFESDAGLAAVEQLDSVVYEVCPGTKVPVTAMDYEFQGMPASLPSGAAKFKLANNAPKEMHEMAVFRLNAKGEGLDPEKFLALPQGKAAKYTDFSGSTFMFAPPGGSGYGLANLTPGKYVYACFIPQGGKKNGKPHTKLGMYGSFTVG